MQDSDHNLQKSACARTSWQNIYKERAWAYLAKALHRLFDNLDVWVVELFDLDAICNR